MQGDTLFQVLNDVKLQTWDPLAPFRMSGIGKFKNMMQSLQGREPEAFLLPLQGGTLFQVLDDVEPQTRDPLAPFRMSVIDKFKDMGTIAMGKSEAGLVRKNDRLYVMPNKCALRAPLHLILLLLDSSERSRLAGLCRLIAVAVSRHGGSL